MDDFDANLRDDLAQAAEQAPTFRGLDTTAAEPDTSSGRSSGFDDVTTQRRRKLRPAVWIPAAAAAVVAALAVPLAMNGNGDLDEGSSGQASCAARLELGGQTYSGHGEGIRQPRIGAKIGEATLLGCQDVPDESVVAYPVPGVPTAQAVYAIGGVWVAEDLQAVPSAIAALDEPVSCASPGPVTFTGDWIAARGPMPANDNEMVLPYTAQIVAESGDKLPLGEWASVQLDVRVTDATRGGNEPQSIEKSLRGNVPVTVTAHCEGGRFVADSMRMAQVD